MRMQPSIAAKKIHISQSALSQFVTNFEAAEGVQLFNRKNGRLESLTEVGTQNLSLCDRDCEST